MRPEPLKSHSIKTGPLIPGRIHSLVLHLNSELTPTMNITEAIVQLDNWQAQIIHGPTLFREIADLLRETVKQKNDAQAALKNLLAIKAAKDAQGTSPAYVAAKNRAWKVAEELVGKQPIRADLDCPRPRCRHCNGMGWMPSKTDTDTDPCPKCEGGFSPQNVTTEARP